MISLYPNRLFFPYGFLPRVHFAQPDGPSIQLPARVPESHICVLSGTNVATVLTRNDALKGSFSIETKFGTSPEIFYGEVNGIPFYHIPLHGHMGVDRSQPGADRDCLLRTWTAMHLLGVKEVLGGATAGALDTDIKVGDRVFLGTERFRQYNIIFPRTVTFSGIATLFSGPNETVFGLDYFDKDVRNTFLFDNRGTYVFASIDDWEAGTPASLSHRFESPGTNVTAIWTERVWSPFIQNTWHANQNFSMTFGLRWDMNDFPEAPPFNQKFQDFFGRPNNHTIDGTTIFSPRFSFNWDIRGDRSWQLRGGFGKFYGKAAGVWLSNPFTNNGLVTVTAGFPDGPPPFEPDPRNQPTGVPGSPSGEVDSLQDGLELPSSWKAVLATDFRFKAPLFGDLVASVEGEWSFVDKALTLHNIGVEPVGIGPDGRTIFSDARIAAAGFGGFGMVTELRNTNLGNSAYYTLSLERPRKDDGWYSAFSYTYGNSEDVNSLTGFIAVENFRATPIFNANSDELGTSPFEIRHRFIWSVSKDINWGGKESLWKSNLTLFYEGRSGKPYSYVFNHPFGRNLNGDDIFFSQSINDLFYTPRGTDDPYVTWDGNLDGTLDESEIAPARRLLCPGRCSSRSRTRKTAREK